MIFRWCCFFFMCYALVMCHPRCEASEWTTEDTYREIAAEVLLVADWGQTKDIKRHKGAFETNVYLGQHPSDGEINNYFVGVLILHPVIAYVLPKDWRHAFQYGTIFIEASMVNRNFGLGMQIKF